MSVVIQARQLGKRYRMTGTATPTLYGRVRDWMKGVKPEEFWAIREADFSIESGRVVGIIGPNGAGKSSTLGLAAGTIHPTTGSIEVQGRTSSLLELGAGFHADLTGRENIYLNAALMGIDREVVEARFEQIVAFADLEGFIDEPVKTYSSGMYVRLGFAVATEVDPDVLLVDEVLAVGDLNFQRKCYQRFAEFKSRGKTILFVSHDLGIVQTFCDEVLLIEHGRITDRGNAEEVVAAYQEKYLEEGARPAAPPPPPKPAPSPESENPDQAYGDADFEDEHAAPDDEPHRLLTHEHGNRDVEIRNVKLLDEHGQESTRFKLGRPMHVDILYESKARVENPVFGYCIKRENGTFIWGTNSQNQQVTIDAIEGRGVMRLTIDPLNLWDDGEYFLSLSIHSWDHATQFHRREDWYKFEVIEGDPGEGIHRVASHWERRT